MTERWTYGTRVKLTGSREIDDTSPIREGIVTKCKEDDGVILYTVVDPKTGEVIDTAFEESDMERIPLGRVEVSRYIVGICGMQVCAVGDATDEEMLAVANSQNPSGTSAGWTYVHRESNADHELLSDQCLPGQCADHADRKHFLIFC